MRKPVTTLYEGAPRPKTNRQFTMFALAAAVLLSVVVGFSTVAPAQVTQPPEPAVATPNFWDQQQRIGRPVLPALARVRFLTSLDYPPFNFLDRRGRLTGFNVELARAICDELDIIEICQIEARPFADLAHALEAGEAEAVIAGLAISPETRARFGFTDPYLRFPARFVGLRDGDFGEALETGLVGVPVAVVTGSAHEAMLRAFFPEATIVPAENREAMLAAMRGGAARVGFGDGISLSFWLASATAENCCRFVGGPFLSDVFLGEGLAIAVAPQQAGLAEAFDYALSRIVADRRFSELLLRYFPISAF